MKKKKLYRYVELKDAVCTFIENGKERTYAFPATKARKQFKLPWLVRGKGLLGKLV